MPEDELVVSLDVKSLYTNVTVEEAIEIALRELYSSDEVPEIPRSAMKSLLRLAVTNVHFKCNKMWYNQSDGLAMGASLVVILANLWMKSFEKIFAEIKKGKGDQNSWHKGDTLLSEGKESSANHAKTVFMQNFKVSLTQNIRPCRKLFGSVPIVQKKVEKRTHWN